MKLKLSNVVGGRYVDAWTPETSGAVSPCLFRMQSMKSWKSWLESQWKRRDDWPPEKECSKFLGLIVLFFFNVKFCTTGIRKFQTIRERIRKREEKEQDEDKIENSHTVLPTKKKVRPNLPANYRKKSSIKNLKVHHSVNFLLVITDI